MTQTFHPHFLTVLFVRALTALALVTVLVSHASSQDKRAKVRISNAGFTITALPLLAAKDWGTFSANGLDAELIVMTWTPSRTLKRNVDDFSIQTA